MIKNTILALAIAANTLVACNSGDNKTKESPDSSPNTQANSKVDNAIAMSATDTKNPVSIKEIVAAYLQLKNSFTEDNTANAAIAGKALEVALVNFDKAALTSVQKKTFEDVEEDAREHAEHIGSNNGNIVHQREHFEILSNDMYDLVKAFGSEQVLYKDFCPMYNNGKGAFWLSETEEINNPYFGKSMAKCGSIKEEIKQNL